MRSGRADRFASGSLVVLLSTVLLAVGSSPTSAGRMFQRGIGFGEERAPAEAEMPAPGDVPLDAATHMARRVPKPSGLTRDKTTVKLVMEVKYGDEEDPDRRGYDATFEATYVIRNKKEKEKVTVPVNFPFPDTAETLRDASVTVDGKEPENVEYTQARVSWKETFEPKQQKEITVKYRAFGTDEFLYGLDRDHRMKELDFAVTVNGTDREPVLPPRVCLRPTTPLTRSENSFSAQWKYQGLLTTKNIHIQIPPRFLGSNVLERFPRLVLAGVATLVLFGLLLLAGGLASENTVTIGQYGSIALALAVFYPMLLYLSRHMPVYYAFLISFVAVGLLVLYSLRRSHGLKFALGYGGLGLVVLLGLFSAAALATKGAGVLVTVGVLVLVASAMYLAPRIALARPKPELPAEAPPPAPAATAEEAPAADVEESTEEASASDTVEAEPPPVEQPRQFCSFCGAQVEESFFFCPRCGRGTQIAFQCTYCGTQVCLHCGESYRFCPGCGAGLPHLGEAEPEQGQ